MFPDVPPRLWAWHEIGACAQAHIVLGFSSDGCYHYERPVTRDQMAVYTARALAGGDENVPSGPAVASFRDVPKDFWAYDYIEYAAQRNVVQGYEDGTYDPSKELDRGQMAVFIARSICDPTGEEGLAGFPLPPRPTFADIPSEFWAYRHIEYLAASDRQVVRGYPDGLYHPEFICRRDQMAVYVARAFALPPWPPEGSRAGEGGE
jgi:hypothetical protein